jgi:protein required for attachment to host cells
MSTEMIVAANAARARLFRRGAVGEPLVEVVTLVHPQSRQVGHDLAADRMGHGEFERWVLFASSPFLGELKAALDAELQRSLHAAIDLDLTSYGLSEVDERARAALRERP